MAEKKKKSLSAQKGQVTKAIDKLQAALQNPETDNEVIEELLDTLNKRFSKVENLHDELSELIESEEEMEAISEEIEQYLSRVQDVKVKAKKKIGKKSVVPSTAHAHQVKLPDIRLPKFGGDVLEWPRFWDLFTATIDEDQKLSDVHKFTYLTGQLEGEAAEVIKELRVSSENYKKAKELLTERYERPDTLIFKHVQALLHLEIDKNKKDTLSRLKSCMDQVNIHIRSLETLGIDGTSYGVILVPLILSRLPHEIVQQWSRKSKGKEQNLQYLLDLCNEEMQIKERTQSVRYTNNPTNGFTERTTDEKGKYTPRKSSPKRSTAATLTTMNEDPQCIFCDRKNHKATECRTVKKFSWDQIKDKVQKNGVCYKCLNSGHIAKDCRATCATCGRGHHSIICRPREQQHQTATIQPQANDNTRNQRDAQQDQDEPSPTGSLSCMTQSTQDIIMQTASIKAAGQKKTLTCNVLFDSGSNQTYIKREIADKLGCKTIKTIQHQVTVFGGNKSQFTQKSVREVILVDIWGNSHAIQAIEMDRVCAPLIRPNLPKEVFLRGLTFANQPSGAITIDILIGLDYYWKFFGSQITRIQDNLVAHNTPFGNIISGQCHECGTGDSRSVLSHNLFLMASTEEPKNIWDNGWVTHCQVKTVTQREESSLDKDVRYLWSLEWCGIDDPNVEEDAVYKYFKETTKFDALDKRYVVRLPWKPNAHQLQNNEESARKRCIKQYNKLSTEQRQSYEAIFREWEENKIIEPVPEDELEATQGRRVFYLPHRPVIRESSQTTKVRPVFDGSAKDPQGLSINETLHTGPKLQKDISEILMRFRTKNIAITADISKAFLQIQLTNEDKDATRFFLPDGTQALKVYRFTRVPFGLNCSPFLLNASLKCHLDKYEGNAVAEELKSNLYVDDFLSGGDTSREVENLKKESNSITNDASMSLTKWRSNSIEFRDETAHESKVLGLFWDSKTDTFQYNGIEIPSDVIITKRLILSCIARIYDPLGFLQPFIIKGKILFQNAWSYGYDWDEEITDSETHQEFKKWINGLREIKAHFRISRRYTKTKTYQKEDKKLHVYCDASEKAYGAVVYLETSHGLSIIIAKSKVAPLKKVCLPRLELIACVLGAQLLQKVQIALNLQNDHYQCHTDSTIALCQIRKEPNNWKPFVANRVASIQQLSDPSRWRHIPGIANPADMLTRGIQAKKLIHEVQSWLQPKIGKPSESQPESESTSIEEVVSLVTLADKPEPIIDVTRSSNLIKAVRIIGWIKRFLANCQSMSRGISQHKGELSPNEFNLAKETLIQQAQSQEFVLERELLKNQRPIPKSSKLYPLTPFIDARGTLRIKGRLHSANLTYEERHPIILPKDWTAQLIVRDYHRNMKHQGVSSVMNAIRQEYWILGLRRLTKSVTKECIGCQRIQAAACNQPAPALPADRVIKQPPFAVTGVDYAGPLYVNDSEEKQYICLYTCLVTRAVHLELTSSLNAADFLRAFRRFSARRGVPKVVYSDNATTFITASKKLSSLYGDATPQWNFIVPRSPWRGGAWERMVRSVKLQLKKTLGKANIAKAELETVLSEIESAVNSRPLTTVTDNPEDLVPLSPADFLLSKVPADTTSPVEARRSLAKSSFHLQKFWKLWSTSYLKSLPHLVPQFKAKGNLLLGAIVLIADDNIPRLQWPLARIVELIPSEDGLIRTVKLQTARGLRMRPVQRLHLLEGVKSEELYDQSQMVPVLTKVKKKGTQTPVKSVVERTPGHTHTRSGRALKRPSRYN